MAKINGFKFLGNQRADMMKQMGKQGKDAVLSMQLGAAYLPTKLAHGCALNINSSPYQQHVTSICCLIGQSSKEVATMSEMLELGMNMAMLGCVHGHPDTHLSTLLNLREACRSTTKMQAEYPLAITIATRAATMRTGSVEAGQRVFLEEGSLVTLTSDDAWLDKCTADTIFVSNLHLLTDLAVGDELLVNFRETELRVEDVGAGETGEVSCRVLVAGMLQSTSVVNVAGRRVGCARTGLSDGDRDIVDFAIAQNLDVIFVADVRCAADVTDVRDFIGARHESMLLVACIEGEVGVGNVDDILAVADGLMVDRGNLSVSLPVEKLFILQKRMIAKGNAARKPVMVSTQVLSSMSHKSRATRAEIADLAYAVLDGADGILLTKSTSVGAFPLEALTNCVGICREAEASIWQMEAFSDLDNKVLSPTDPLTAVAIATVEASMQLGSHAILVSSSAPNAAVAIASFRPRCAIIAITRFPGVARKLQLSRSVFPLVYTASAQADWGQDVDLRFQRGIEYGMERGIIGKGSSVVLVSGWQHGKASTNTIRVVIVARRCKD